MPGISLTTALAYQALFGESYGQDGLQLKWVAPTDLFIEPFVEVGRGANFPGTDRNENGAGAVAAGVHLGGDVGVSNSWRAGVSYLTTEAKDREFEGHDPSDAEVAGAFTGDSKTWLVDAVWKSAPNGNARERNLKLAAEYFWREESGTVGGCCGAPMLESNLGDPGAGGDGGCGAPVWSVNMVNMNFYLVDTPLCDQLGSSDQTSEETEAECRDPEYAWAVRRVGRRDTARHPPAPDGSVQ